MLQDVFVHFVSSSTDTGERKRSNTSPNQEYLEPPSMQVHELLRQIRNCKICKSEACITKFAKVRQSYIGKMEKRDMNIYTGPGDPPS